MRIINRLAMLSGVALLVGASLAVGEQVYAVPKRDGVPAYASSREVGRANPEATVGTSDRLIIVERSRKAVQVQDSQGRLFWVTPDDISEVRSRKHIFEGAFVTGHFDNPSVTYILDANATEADPVRLDRSFADLLREHRDRQGFQRHSRTDPGSTELF